MRAWIGTSGFAYPAWKGRFYPRDLRADGMLAYYAGAFAAVEINSAFYRMPTATTFAAWPARTPRAFRFAVKAPALITHRKRLRDVAADCARFAAATAALGAKRGPVLLQLPPRFARDATRLADALAAFPRGVRVACEFRDPSWFAEETYAVLRAHRAALCIAEGDAPATPTVATAPWGYLRLRRLDYRPRDLARWAERIAAQPWRECFAFTRHEDTAAGVGFARALRAALRDAGVDAPGEGGVAREPRAG